MDKVFSLKNKTLKNSGKMEKNLEKSGKSQGISSVRKSGNQEEESIQVGCVWVIVTWGPPDRMTDRHLPASSLASDNNFSFLQSICTKNIKDLDDDYEAQICGSYRRGTTPHVGGHSYQRPPVNYKSKGPP